MLQMTLGAMLVALYAFLWLGLPALFAARLRQRREAAAVRQIALTDAIHSQLGPIVSPVVSKPLRGPWQIRIAVPLTRPLVAGRLLTVVQQALASDRTQREQYRIVLTFTPGPETTRQASPSGRYRAGWVDRATAA